MEHLLGIGRPEGLGAALAVDASGNVFVAGISNSTWDSPVVPFHAQSDGFLAKLSGSGTLLWNTFLGVGNDSANSVAVDGSGNVCVGGDCTASWGNPINPYAGGSNDLYLAKVSDNGVLQWNTFLAVHTTRQCLRRISSVSTARRHRSPRAAPRLSLSSGRRKATQQFFCLGAAVRRLPAHFAFRGWHRGIRPFLSPPWDMESLASRASFAHASPYAHGFRQISQRRSAHTFARHPTRAPPPLFRFSPSPPPRFPPPLPACRRDFTPRTERSPDFARRIFSIQRFAILEPESLLPPMSMRPLASYRHLARAVSA